MDRVDMSLGEGSWSFFLFLVSCIYNFTFCFLFLFAIFREYAFQRILWASSVIPRGCECLPISITIIQVGLACLFPSLHVTTCKDSYIMNYVINELGNLEHFWTNVVTLTASLLEIAYLLD